MVSQSRTSSPQLPNRGLSTSGRSERGIERPSRTCVVAGCGRSLRRRIRAVSSLSCAARSAGGSFNTTTPRAASAPSAHRPSSMPSSVGSTSRRPSTASPGPRRSSACFGVIASQRVSRGDRSARETLVGVSRQLTTAKRMAKGCLYRGAAARGDNHFDTRYTPKGVSTGQFLVRPVRFLGSRARSGSHRPAAAGSRSSAARCSAARARR